MNIKQDTLKFSYDKKAHFAVSFGLYYFFFTYTGDIIVSLVSSILIGLAFEVYQGYSSKHSGYSHTDMVYNIGGAIIAFILHDIVSSIVLTWCSILPTSVVIS